MKRIYFLAMIAFLASCGPYQKIPATTASNVLNINKENNQDQYDLVVLDPGFHTWYETNWSPAKDHLYQYYKMWNDQYVTDWNYKATHMGYSSYFDNVINYDPNVDYGMEVARKLYYYFRYVELVKKIQILDYRRPNDVI